MTWTPESTDRFRELKRRADASRTAGDHRDAIEHYTNAMVLRSEDLTLEQEGELRVAIAECFLELGDISSADTALSPTERFSSELTADAQGAVSIVRSKIALYRGELDESLRAANAAWDALRETGRNLLVARALTCRAHAHRQRGDLQAAQHDYTDAMAAARRADSEHEIGNAAAHLGSLLWLSGSYVEARDWHRRAVECHEVSGSAANLSRDLFSLAIDEFHAGDWQQADALFTRAAERAERDGDAWLTSVVAIARARLEHRRGQDPRTELAELRRAATAGEYAHDLVVIGMIVADIAMERGDWDEAYRELHEALTQAMKSSSESEPVVQLQWRLAAVEQRRNASTDLERFETAIDTAVAHGYRVAEIAARRSYGLALLAQGRIDEARREIEAALSLAQELELPYEVGCSQLALGELGLETAEAAMAAPTFRAAEVVLQELGAERELGKAAEGLAAATGEGIVLMPGEDPFAAIETQSDVLLDAIDRARRIAPSNIPVLVTGETGTGKELFARAIHAASSRSDRPFLAVNCAALSEALLESELFGHEQGSFTGADRRKVGIFEAANGGTVFLDEVGKAPASLQAKLLRVLDTGEVRRVGGLEAMHVDVRIVAATNKDLESMVHEEGFLPDLLYRLRGFEIRVAPLRERADDVALLFEKFAGRPASDAALDVLRAHDWPGNVREIRNVAESAAFLSYGNEAIAVDSLPDWIRNSRRREPIARLADTERESVLRALEEAEGNRSRAARALGISRQTLYSKLSKYGIGRADAA